MTDDGATTVLKVEGLVTQFHTPASDVRAVDGVSLTVARQQTLGIVGESGSGKTVLVRSIMGLLPPRNLVRSGRVWLSGTDLIALKPRELRQFWGTQVAMVFQNPMSSLNPVRTVGAQIATPLRYHLKISRSDARARAADLLRSVGIPDPSHRLRQYPHQLSGGMRQRVMIAIAISCGPQLLLADEPTTALDVTVQKQVLDLLTQQKHSRHMAMVLVTHDLGVVAAHSDQVAVMYAGRIVEMAPTKKLFSRPHMPYTEALFESIPRAGDPSHKRLNAIGGRPPNLAALPPGCAFAERCRYAEERCRRERPDLRPIGVDGTHLVACWKPVGLDGQSARGAA